MDTKDPQDHLSPVPCRACGGSLQQAFRATLLGDIEVLYGQCRNCGSLMIPEPTWLDRAYSVAPFPDPDVGDLRRALMLWRVARRLRFQGLLPPLSRCLDFGVGKGMLLRSLLDDNQDAWGYDPYPRAAFAQDRVVDALPAGPFDLITAVEVIEHTLDPIPTLQGLAERLAPGGLLLVTTEFYRAGIHGPGWHYLGAEQGQHITIFSSAGFAKAAEQAGLTWAGSLANGRQPFVHVLTRGKVVSGLAWLRLKVRHHLGERRARKLRFA